jgi:hypothetical protein
MTKMFGAFSNYGFVRDVIPSTLFENLKTEVAQLDLTDTLINYNKNLAGNIEKEYRLSIHRQELESYVLDLCKQYENYYGTTNTSKDITSNNLEMYVYWANLQKKYEFNPMHTHDGAYSFVIWLKIPYVMTDEFTRPAVKQTNMPRAGMFSFIYTNVFGEIREAEFPVDKSYEGTIFVFPSALSHQVYPFYTSDEYRISISGNIRKKQCKT